MSEFQVDPNRVINRLQEDVSRLTLERSQFAGACDQLMDENAQLRAANDQLTQDNTGLREQLTRLLSSRANTEERDDEPAQPTAPQELEIESPGPDGPQG